MCLVNVSLSIYSSVYFHSRVFLNCWSPLVRPPRELIIKDFLFSTFQELGRIVLLCPFWSEAWPCDLLQPTNRSRRDICYFKAGASCMWSMISDSPCESVISDSPRSCSTGVVTRICQDRPYISLDLWKTSRSSRPFPSLCPLPGKHALYM